MLLYLILTLSEKCHLMYFASFNSKIYCIQLTEKIQKAFFFTDLLYLKPKAWTMKGINTVKPEFWNFSVLENFYFIIKLNRFADIGFEIRILYFLELKINF